MGDQSSKGLVRYENTCNDLTFNNTNGRYLVKSPPMPVHHFDSSNKYVQRGTQTENVYSTPGGITIEEPFKMTKRESNSASFYANETNCNQQIHLSTVSDSQNLRSRALQTKTCNKLVGEWKSLTKLHEIKADVMNLVQNVEQSMTYTLSTKNQNLANKNIIGVHNPNDRRDISNTSFSIQCKGEKSTPAKSNGSNVEHDSRLNSNEQQIQQKKTGSRGSEEAAADIPIENIRNFSIIAHVDHGKSTLADRLLEMTGAVVANPQNKQVLDRLQVEKERGITVKAQTASLSYNHKGTDYLLNLIDTPGHVDFSNEVSRSVAACQGVILLVDANQGVQAQTVANYHLANDKGLVVLPVLNKIDLKNANPEGIKEQLFNLFTIDPDDVLMISAKVGIGMDTVIDALVRRIPHPPGDRAAPFRALIFDSWFDQYRGAVAMVYVRDGLVQLGDEICSAYTKKQYQVRSLGLLRPHEETAKKLVAGQVGFVVCNMRSVSEAHIGDTLHLKHADVEPLASFSAARPMVYAGVYPMDQSELAVLKSAIEKLALNDPAVSITTDSSPVLGNGWRIGFLGLLHLEVFNQRLEQEYGAEAIMTAPSVSYKVKVKGKKSMVKYGEEVVISDPSKLPEREAIEEISEPMVLGTIITPMEYMQQVMTECIERRGKQTSVVNIDATRVMLKFELPLNEIIVDFHDAIKASTSGYASFDYEEQGFSPSNVVKLDILLNGKVVDALSSIVHSSKAALIGKRVCAKLAEILPRQQVQIAIQAAVGGKILARENIKSFRKDVTAKLYGGDVTRKMKLREKQAAGKKKMKQIANVNIPRETFIDFLKR